MASRTVLKALEVYVQQNHDWPNNIEALRDRVTVDGPFEYDWPANSNEILSRVKVVFGVHLSYVANTTADEFPFVIPDKPIYKAPFESGVERQLMIVKESLSSASTD